MCCWEALAACKIPHKHLLHHFDILMSGLPFGVRVRFHKIWYMAMATTARVFVACDRGKVPKGQHKVAMTQMAIAVTENMTIHELLHACGVCSSTHMVACRAVVYDDGHAPEADVLEYQYPKGRPYDQIFVYKVIAPVSRSCSRSRSRKAGTESLSEFIFDCYSKQLRKP